MFGNISVKKCWLDLVMNAKFAVCINNRGFETSLEFGKLYEIVEDTEAENDEMLRVVDEDGEDLLFEAKFFISRSARESLKKIYGTRSS